MATGRKGDLVVAAATRKQENEQLLPLVVASWRQQKMFSQTVVVK